MTSRTRLSPRRVQVAFRTWQVKAEFDRRTEPLTASRPESQASALGLVVRSARPRDHHLLRCDPRPQLAEQPWTRRALASLSLSCRLLRTHLHLSGLFLVSLPHPALPSAALRHSRKQAITPPIYRLTEGRISGRWTRFPAPIRPATALTDRLRLTGGAGVLCCARTRPQPARSLRKREPRPLARAGLRRLSAPRTRGLESVAPQATVSSNR